MKAKFLSITIISILSFNSAIAQVYQGAFEEIYFLREPSTSAEATGKTYLFFNNDAFSSSYNPSLPSLLKSVNASYTNSKKLYSQENANYHSIALNIPVKEIGVISASRRFYDFGEDIEVSTINNPDGTGKKGRVTEAIYNINIARQIFTDFYLGLGINYLHNELIINKFDYYSASLGLAFIHTFNSPDVINQKLFLGAAVNNFISFSSNNEVNIITQVDENLPPNGNENATIDYKISLPQINLWTLGYKMDYNGIGLLKDMSDLTSTIQIEYLDVLNAGKYNRYSTGIELKFLGILAARIGYYSFDDTYSKKEDFTYGIGINVPINLFTELPLSIGFDYTSLEQEAGSPYFHFQNFNSLTFSLVYGCWLGAKVL